MIEAVEREKERRGRDREKVWKGENDGEGEDGEGKRNREKIWKRGKKKTIEKKNRGREEETEISYGKEERRKQ